MAEEEKIREHAKHALKALTNKKKKWTERLRDFLWEILIIVVAINLTLWFHNWSDKRHDRELEKNFLIDIRENLIADTAMLQAHNNFFTENVIAYYDSVLYQIKHNQINTEYIDSNSGQLINNKGVGFDNSIFQSFSSAGNLRLIENRKLLSDIMFLYSTVLPGNITNSEYVAKYRQDIFEKYIGSKIDFDDTLSCKLSTIIHQPEVKYVIQWGSLLLNGVSESDKNNINHIVAVIHEIDKELKDRFNYEVADKNKK